MEEENVEEVIIKIINNLCSLQQEIEQLKLTLKEMNSNGNQFETKKQKKLFLIRIRIDFS